MNETAIGNAVTCRWCGKLHSATTRCPEVKAMDFHPDGTVRRVEFYSPNDYAPQSHVHHHDSAPLLPRREITEADARRVLTRIKT